MDREVFFQHLCDELRQNDSLYPYYKLTYGSSGRQKFRKAYFLQRLSYLDRYIDRSSQPAILDCGCGFGSVCLYLAMNGLPSKGTTLEFYIDQIEKRKEYWKQFGDASLFIHEYENIFDAPPAAESLDYIILQDTLHHIEPLSDALNIFYAALKKNGKLILIEENGASLIKSFILFLRRGNKRVVSYYDEILKKDILLGNENIRTEQQWIQAFHHAGFRVDSSSIQYLRFLPPFCYYHQSGEKIAAREQNFWAKNTLVKKYGFFGLNMVFTK